MPFLDNSPEIRRVLYSTNAIESINSRLLQAIRAWPSSQDRARNVVTAAVASLWASLPLNTKLGTAPCRFAFSMVVRRQPREGNLR